MYDTIYEFLLNLCIGFPGLHENELRRCIANGQLLLSYQNQCRFFYSIGGTAYIFTSNHNRTNKMVYEIRPLTELFNSL